MSKLRLVVAPKNNEVFCGAPVNAYDIAFTLKTTVDVWLIPLISFTSTITFTRPGSVPLNTISVEPKEILLKVPITIGVFPMRICPLPMLPDPIVYFT